MTSLQTLGLKKKSAILHPLVLKYGSAFVHLGTVQELATYWDVGCETSGKMLQKGQTEASLTSATM